MDSMLFLKNAYKSWVHDSVAADFTEDSLEYQPIIGNIYTNHIRFI